MSLSLLPFFIVGLLGSVHCIGMCGGIVGALTMGQGSGRRVPVAVVAAGGVQAGAAALHPALQALAYNAGRIGSYALAGAVAGGAASGVRTLSSVSAIQAGAYVLANLLMIALGLYLMNVWSGVARIEQPGKFLWKRLQPLTRRLLPMDTPSKALMLGGLWGWVPCAMVYSVLFSAMLSGSAASGASIMLAFGLGTLPMLLGMSLLGLRLRALANSSVRFGGGVIVAGFGLLGLWRAFAGLPAWLDLLCLTPGMH